MIGLINGIKIKYQVNIPIQKYKTILCAVNDKDPLIALLIREYRYNNFKFILIDPEGFWARREINSINTLSIKVGTDFPFNPLLPPINVTVDEHIDLLRYLFSIYQDNIDMRIPSHWKLVFNQALQSIINENLDITNIIAKIHDYLETTSGFERHCYIILKNIFESIFTGTDLKTFDNQEKLNIGLFISSLNNADGIIIDLSTIWNNEFRALIEALLIYYIINYKESMWKNTLIINKADLIYSSSKSLSKLFPSDKHVVIVSGNPELLHNSLLNKIDLIIGHINYLPLYIKGLRKVDSKYNYFIFKRNWVIYFDKIDVKIPYKGDIKFTKLETKEVKDIISKNKRLVISILKQLKEHGGLGIKGVIALNPTYKESDVRKIIHALLTKGYIRVKKVGVEKLLTISVKGLLYFKEVSQDAN